MDATDRNRHHEKIGHALTACEKYLTTMNESNAALHMADKVFYSPLTVAVHDALESLQFLKDAPYR
jgi:hypothetical protein